MATSRAPKRERSIQRVRARRQRHERKRDPEERGAAAELEIRRPHVQADQHAGGAARRLGGVRDNSEHFRKSQRHEGEVGPAQPGAEAQIADGGADQGSGREAEREPDPRVDAEPHLQDRRRVRAGTEEGRMAEGELAAEPAEDVPALGRERDDQGKGEEIEHGVRAREQTAQAR